MKIKGSILIIMIFINAFVNMTFSQQIKIAFSINKDSVSFGDSVKVSWNVENADKVYIAPFGLVNHKGEKTKKVDSNYTFMIIARNEKEEKVIKKNVFLKTLIKGVEYGNDEDYVYPIKGRVKSNSLLEFSEILEEILQNELRFSMAVSGSTDRNIIVMKTNLANKNYLLLPEDKKNRINKRRISYLISYQLNEMKNEVYFTLKALIQKKKKIKLNYTKETNEDIYHSEILKLKSLIEAKL